MGKILVIGANGSVGKSCVNNLKDDNDLVLISRSEFDSGVEGNFDKNVLDINDYTNTESFIKSINYEISGIIFAIMSISPLTSSHVLSEYSFDLYISQNEHSLNEQPNVT